MEAGIIHRFLESVGQKADIDLYLKHFRTERLHRFAIIAADAQVMREALDSFHFDLRILAGLGLRPVVLLGLHDASDAVDNAQELRTWLEEDGVPARVLPAEKALAAEPLEHIHQGIHSALAAAHIPIVALSENAHAENNTGFSWLAQLALKLTTRKVIFLSASAGIERPGFPRISEVNLERHYADLVQSPALSRRHQELLRQVKDLFAQAPHRMSVAFVNPLQLLRELFTVGGAGTLVRTGSRVVSHNSLDTVDTARLTQLVQSAFGRSLRPGALDRAWLRIYVEENYRGAALLTRTDLGHYLSKFAVERQAQGDGIGGDIWDALDAHHPCFFWRAKRNNPIAAWYSRKCDGMARSGDWIVFWIGAQAKDIPDLITYACAQPLDLVDATP